MQEEDHTTSTLGGSQRVLDDRKDSLRWEERVRPCSRSLWWKNQILKDHRPRSPHKEGCQALPPRKFYTYTSLHIPREKLLMKIKGQILRPGNYGPYQIENIQTSSVYITMTIPATLKNVFSFKTRLRAHQMSLPRPVYLASHRTRGSIEITLASQASIVA